MRVKEILKKAVTVQAAVSLKDAAKLMVSDNIGSLIVMDGDSIAGIITERDMLKSVCESTETLRHPVSEFMSKELITVNSHQQIDDAANMMSQHNIKKLPVVDDGKLMGIITSTDIVAHHDDLNDLSVF